ncbi:hypothetical protein [Glycomyces albidus]|uniref:Uncharacterized protein n=1 Tax=Glycomyces albidus TaxID=2656774 RepID=A0A6L5G692_9ACTN|nr:hypothetical protein [Glycomyces albidus]MQM25142.1 hypothetical protein [Glycomyces albidus]
MTTKELLHRLVDDLGEPQAAEALTWIRARYGMPDPCRDDTTLPEWVGSFSSGRGDLAERHEETLRDEGDGR